MAERRLGELLRGMNPVLDQDDFVFATVPADEFPVPLCDPLCTFREREAVTVILRQRDADRLGLEFAFPCKMITLNVVSDLEAVGFLAAVTAKLAEHEISVNAVSGYYHDHLFVPRHRGQDALDALRELQR